PSLREHICTTLDRPSVNKYWGTGSKFKQFLGAGVCMVSWVRYSPVAMLIVVNCGEGACRLDWCSHFIVLPLRAVTGFLPMT
ncbi:MAG: hypothetical protein K2L41_08395, partial [Muribaculaceae bacterium]|nr:hypothetical protein [Muribaculaceae bacterium]